MGGGAIPHSHKTTLNTCMYGAKRWILVNPMDYPSPEVRAKFEQIDKMKLQRQGNVAEQEEYSSQHWYSNESAELLQSLGIPFYEFIQTRGDAIFIPDFYTHATIDLCRETLGVELMGEVVHRGYENADTSGLTERGDWQYNYAAG